MRVHINKLKKVRVIAYRTVALSVLIRKAKASRPVRIVREVFALLSLLRLRREPYAWPRSRGTGVSRRVRGGRDLPPAKGVGPGFAPPKNAKARPAPLV